MDAAGRVSGGALEAADAERATAEVRRRGLFPTRVESAGACAPAGTAPRRGGGAIVIGRIVSAHGLAEFTRQLGTLVQAGLPLLRALQVLGRQQRNKVFRGVIEAMAAGILAGESLSGAMARHPRVFGETYRGLIRAGETGGRLDVALLQLARFLEKAERIRRRVQAALYYPAAVLTVTVLILTALMLFVVPRFRTIFQEQLRGADLPGLTAAVLATSDFVGANLGWIALAGAGAGTLAGGLRALPRGRRWLDAATLRLPVVGALCGKLAVVRFARTLGTLLGNGVAILQALQVARATVGNAVFAAALDGVHARVQAGATVSAALGHARCFPDLLVSMVAVGEETGALAEMLGRVADAFDEEVDTAVGGLTALLEPVLIVFLSLTVGTVVIALFLPIVRIIQTMS